MDFVQISAIDGNKQKIFSKKILKIFTLEASCIRGMKLNSKYMFISLCMFFCLLLLLPMCFSCYGSQCFHRLIFGKSGNWH